MKCEELRRKREHVTKIYKGALGVFEAAVRQGSHATLELSERCQAWRFPLFQDFIRRLELHTAVVKGCSVNLRDQGGRLMSKGWRIVTTCPELARQLTLPCKCDPSYKHGVCEGEAAKRSAMYTKELAKRVVRGMSRELRAQGVLRECQGENGSSGGFWGGRRVHLWGRGSSEEPRGLCQLPVGPAESGSRLSRGGR